MVVPSIIFTRYLYIKDEVKISVIISLLKKDKDRTLFWAYELYYSGFKDELIQLFWNIYYDFYQTLNSSMEKYLKTKLILEFEEIDVMNIIDNFIIRPISIDTFMIRHLIYQFDFDHDLGEIKLNDYNYIIHLFESDEYLLFSDYIFNHIKEERIIEIFIQIIDYFINKGCKINKKTQLTYIKQIEKKKTHSLLCCIIFSKIIYFKCLYDNRKMGKNIYISHDETEDLSMYQTLEADLSLRKDNKQPLNCLLQKLPSHKIMPLVCVYNIEDDDSYISLFHLNRHKNNMEMKLHNLYYYHWEYYAFYSPIWEDRIIEHNGTINHDLKRITFLCDEKQEDFYQLYGYEPDEQKKHIQNKSVKSFQRKNKWTDFYEEFKSSCITSLDKEILEDIVSWEYKYNII